MKMQLITRAIGAPLNRLDGVQKVTGAATYAYEYAVEGATYVFPVQSTIARGRVSSIDASAARALPGVIAVLSHENAPQLAPLNDAKLAVFQSESVAYRGQFVAAVVAETSEMARQEAEIVVVGYEEQPHDVELRADRPDLYTPQIVNPFYQSDTASGDVETALAQAPVSLDSVYTTPAEHPNPLDPHTTVAVWNEDSVTLYDANQGPHPIRDTVATAFKLPPERVRVISQYVGGAFGSKVDTHPHVILAVMAAQVARRPVKLALTRQQMFPWRAIARPPSSACSWVPSAVGGLGEGARRCGWQPRDPTPRLRRAGPWLIGTGVAASSYPALQFPAAAQVSVDQAGNYQVRIDAIDIGTGAWTALTQIAADALEVPPERVQLGIGDTSLPQALWATASTGTASWGWAIFNAASALRARLQEELGGSGAAEGL